MSEIDAIFATGKASVSAPNVAPSSPKKDKKKKKKKGASDAVPASHDAAPVASSSSKKRPAPETVLDTSHHLSGPPKRHKGDQPKPSEEPKASKSRSKAVDADAAFKDSRGTADRRKTEEGWLVYKEDELGIGDEGGGEPLCVHYFLLFTATRVQTHPYVHLIVIAVFELPLQYTSFFRQSPNLFSSPSLHGSFEASPIAPYNWKRSICSQH